MSLRLLRKFSAKWEEEQKPEEEQKSVTTLGAFVYFFPQFLGLPHEMRTTRK